MVSKDERAVNQQVHDLVVQANEKRNAAIELALQAYGNAVFGYLTRMVRDDVAVREIYGDFTKRLVEHIQEFKGDGQSEHPLKIWMLSLGRTALERHYRDPIFRNATYLDISDAERLPQPQDQSTSVSTRLERDAAIASEVDNLPSEQKELVILRMEEISYDDIVKMLKDNQDLTGPDLKRESAKLRTQYRRIVKKLRQQLLEKGIRVPLSRKRPFLGV